MVALAPSKEKAAGLHFHGVGRQPGFGGNPPLTTTTTTSPRQGILLKAPAKVASLFGIAHEVDEGSAWIFLQLFAERNARRRQAHPLCRGQGQRTLRGVVG